jgi:hypothetical protein
MGDADATTCIRCAKKFQFPCQLKIHQQRKTPCEPKPDAIANKYQCRFCARGFTTTTAMYRHVRNSCKAKAVQPEVAPPEPAMEQRVAEMANQLARVLLLLEQNQPPAAPARVVKAKTQLVPMPKRQPLAPPAVAAPEPKIVQTINAAVVHNTTNAPTITNNITIQAAAVNITPWDSPEYITVSLADILAAFAENPKLRQYLHMDDFELSDFEKAPPYVIELFIELLLRAHLLEAARNIYLNPSRADQVMVRMKSGSWDVAPLNDSIEHLFNGIARRLHVITITTEERTKLPYDIQNAISICEMMYKDHPDVYIKLAKEVIVAHLTNCRARLIESGAIVQKPRKSG